MSGGFDVRRVLIERAQAHVRATLVDEGELAWWRAVHEREATERAKEAAAAKAQAARRGMASLIARRRSAENESHLTA